MKLKCFWSSLVINLFVRYVLVFYLKITVFKNKTDSFVIQTTRFWRCYNEKNDTFKMSFSSIILTKIFQANTIKVKKQFKNHFNQNVEIQLRTANKVLTDLNIKNIDILKIDTEGWEVEILENLQPFLSETDYILVEYHAEADRRKIDKLLENFIVFSSNAITINWGQVKYINSKLV